MLHRDYFAHYFRWSHIAKLLSSERKECSILDLGCGPGQLADTLYRNRIAPKTYLGIDIRPKLIQNASERFKNAPWAQFKCIDLCSDSLNEGQDWDYIACFEVLEHIKKGPLSAKFIENIKKHMNPDTILLLSTPCYNKSDCADNHIIDGQINEYEYTELRQILEKEFKLINHYGTFASEKDILPHMSNSEQYIFNRFKEYYDSNLLSVIFAPLYPYHSRNCIWELKLK